MNVALFDYGAGNLHSLTKALEASGARVRVTTDPLEAITESALVLPGVGAFGAASARLAPGRDAMRAALERGLPCLGICLGMQLLFDASDEGDGAGLGLFAGHVRRLDAQRVPQIGWNTLESVADQVFATAPLSEVYYANSFVCRPTDTACVVAWSTHEGDRFPAAVRRGRALGVQFHPEKSSRAGVGFLAAWLAQACR